MTTDEERPRLLIVAGPNGSGKTTVTEQGLAHEWFGGCEYINPDLIARDEFGDWNSEASIRKAADVARERRERAVLERRSVAFETVFSGADKIEYPTGNVQVLTPAIVEADFKTVLLDFAWPGQARITSMASRARTRS